MKFILGQEIWCFYEFDKKFGLISFAGRFSEHKPQTNSLKQMEKVFEKVNHFPLVREIIIFKHNMRVINKKFVGMEFSNLKILKLGNN